MVSLSEGEVRVWLILPRRLECVNPVRVRKQNRLVGYGLLIDLSPACLCMTFGPIFLRVKMLGVALSQINACEISLLINFYKVVSTLVMIWQ